MKSSFNDMPINTRFTYEGMWVRKKDIKKVECIATEYVCPRDNIGKKMCINLEARECKEIYYVGRNWQKGEVKKYYDNLLEKQIKEYLGK